jgi:glycine oxidase
LPRFVWRAATTYLNGFYRHGFLLSPAFAQQAAAMILGDAGGQNENHRQRRRA